MAQQVYGAHRSAYYLILFLVKAQLLSDECVRW